MQTDLDDIRRKLERYGEDYDRLGQKIDEEEKELHACKEMELATAEAGMIIQAVAQQVQEQAHATITKIVSKCLAAVFEEPYTFKIHFDRKRGKTEARLIFERDGNEVSPMLGAGGGVRDVAAFALRIACVMMTKPALRRTICLDEPFKNVHGEHNRTRVRELLETLPRELGIQIIMVTGLEWAKCGKVIELEK